MYGTGCFSESCAGPSAGCGLIRNLDELAEDRDVVLSQARSKLSSFDHKRLQEAVKNYGNMAKRKRFREWMGA